MKEYKIELSGQNKKTAEYFGLTEWFPGIDELEIADESIKETIEDLKSKGLELTSIYSGYQVTVTKGKDTEDEIDLEVFGDSIEEAICNAMPLEYTIGQKQELSTMLEADIVNAQADLRELDSKIARTNANIKFCNKELAKTYGNLAAIYARLAELDSK